MPLQTFVVAGTAGFWHWAQVWLAICEAGTGARIHAKSCWLVTNQTLLLVWTQFRNSTY